ncbi:MAG: class I SAM-dependent methyltransferase [Flavisolibacter sp.]|jgi:ubiquinone/menaquinone biosynthesis C-methylase UbiE
MYHPQTYWNDVARRISLRNNEKVLGGDDAPFYRYQRKQFLKILDKIDWKGRSVLEVGSGPGGNLSFLYGKSCSRLEGVDISEEMIALSRHHLHDKNIHVSKINGTLLPFETGSFQVVFTSTVLQHNTNEASLHLLIKEICRVAAEEVIIFERIEKKITGHDSNVGRPVDYYAGMFSENGFSLLHTSFLNVQASYFTGGVIRKIFNNRARREGEPVSWLSFKLEKAAMFFTRFLDPLIPLRRGVAMLQFRKKQA